MGRVWFITGSSKGLGLEIARAALEDGETVAATARNPSSLNPLVEKYGDKVLPLALDVTASYQTIESAVKAVVDKFGRIDVVVNNAGYADIASAEDTNIDSFKAQVDANFIGTVSVTKAVIPLLRQQGSGRVMQVSSVGDRLGTPGLSAYQSAKWAVRGFTGIVAKEMAPFNIKFTTLEPGGIKTDWAQGEPNVSEPYQQTVGHFNQLRKKYAEIASEPATVAQTILKISRVEDPPAQLLLGKETGHLAKEAAKAMAASDAKWVKATVHEF